MDSFWGSLGPSCCGAGGIPQTISLACGEHAQSLGHPGFAPLTACVLSRSTLLRLHPGCSAGNWLRWALGCVHFPGLSRSGSGSRVLHTGAVSVGPAFCALPRPEQLRGPGAWRASLPRPRRWVFWVYGGRTFSGVPCVSSGRLISGCHPPGGCPPSRIPGSLG